MNALTKAMLSAGITLGLLVGIEGLLRVAGVPDPGLYDGDPAWYWTLRPDLDREVPFPEEGTTFTVRTSADGYRDGPLPGASPWVAALGCSTTFGWGVGADEAWPARLEAALGVPVHNGGVPGHSTAQGLRELARILEAGPTVTILAYVVRDAQLAGRRDSAARPTPPLARTHLARLLQGLFSGDGGPSAVGVGVPRVSPPEYRENLDRMVGAARGTGAEPLVLVFPMQRPAVAHVAALEGLDAPVLEPVLDASSFFPSDPIHLTAGGHEVLAGALREPVEALLSGE